MILRLLFGKPKPKKYHIEHHYINSAHELLNEHGKRIVINPDIVKMYSMSIEEFNTKLDDIKKKAQKAMRFTLWLKLIVTLSSIYSISEWLQDHHKAHIWPLILVISEVAGVLLDTLPYFQQRIELPKLKLGLSHIYFDLIEDFVMFERGELSEDEAIRRYWAHRTNWIKTVG